MTEVSLETRLNVRKRPEGIPIMHQDWRDLLFLHWKYDVNEMQKTLPPGLFVDTFNNEAYISIVPLTMNLKVAGILSIPGLSNFIEVNLRTYVYDENGTPGVWFYSLDINSSVAAKVARNTFSLPYFFSDLEQSNTDKGILIQGKRNEDPVVKMKFAYQQADKNQYLAELNSLDYFLVERYVLFSYSANQLSVGQVHHAPYPLSQVNVSEWSTDLLEPIFHKSMNHPPDRIHYSTGVDVAIYTLKKASTFKV